MAIPNFEDNGDLPSGEHFATLPEIEDRFGKLNECREKLMAGLKAAAINLQKAGVRKAWIDGSFVTDKKEPSDIDGCWEYNESVNLDILDPVFTAESTKPMKHKYGLDFYIANFIEAGSGVPFPVFFQRNRDGIAKGIVVLELGEVV